MPRLFALDQNFPQPLIEAATPYFRDVVLEPIWRIAKHQNRDIEAVLGEVRLTRAKLRHDPLGD